MTKPAKKTVTTVETINEPKPSVASSASPQAPHPPAQETEEEEDEDEEDDTKLKDPGVAKFAAAKTITESFAIIQKYPYIVQSQHSDAILAAAFSAAYKEKPGFDVKQMVFQSTILSYCLTLSQGGKDGVALFFKRVADDMKSSAYQGFAADAQAMYDRIMARIKVLQEKDRKDREEAIQRAQARLDAAKQPDGSYRWPIPADASEEDQKKAAIFDTFHKDLQLGLLIEDVDAINKHLSTLTREDGEALLKKIAEGGFLQIIEEGEEEQ